MHERAPKVLACAGELQNVHWFQEGENLGGAQIFPKVA